MARIFTSGTATDGGGSVVTNAATVQSAIRDAILLHSNWSLVEEFTGSGGTMRNTVFKCAAAGSGLPKDFYCVFSRTISNGSILVTMGEDYDPATHILTNCAAGSLGSTRAVDGNGLPTATPTINFAVTQVTSNTPMQTSFSPNASTGWGVIVDNDHVVWWVGSAMTYLFGAITSLVQGTSDPMPVGMIKLGGGSSASGATTSSMTRQPGVTSPAPATSFTVDEPHLPAIFTAGTTWAFTSIDKYQNNKAAAYIIRVTHNSNNIATTGWLRGKLPKCAFISQAPAGSAAGDTFSIDGTTWVVAAVVSNNALVVDTGS